MDEQIKRIKDKLNQLKQLDSELEQFGAERHEYILNPPLNFDEIKQFETAYQVSLPEEYIAFLTTIGNGGAGPFYGVNTLADSRIMYFDNSDKAQHSYFELSKPFPYTESWNVEEALAAIVEKIDQAYENGNEELEEQLLAEKSALIDLPQNDYGRLNISDYGCGITISLVINGEEKGKMWTDDRVNDGGIYPSVELENPEKISFLDWYELWLDNTIKESTI
ncbi:SMI1/KNR4 family protein [Pedobacter cryoconitis]|uniref:SMI1/KNR4 family protein SUKH-1 n=1 Tax=Pedobacter cryoconitis TaxID=188932 RepID=A0A327SML1_9SPHI|nr:SMI1/KNR4 family protein [Pedobacter cryoconitis]RAJ30199.1 SMI1/KNR4 family protein SUKH-1 [Pedobacter cryoconitis]